MMNGVVVGLRPVEVVSSDYALMEYGLTNEEVTAAEQDEVRWNTCPSTEIVPLKP